MTTTPFTVIIPPVLPHQKAVTHNLAVEVDDSGVVHTMVPDSMDVIERIEMLGRINMLYDAVQFLARSIPH